jgi:hypothetical protein
MSGRQWLLAEQFALEAKTQKVDPVLLIQAIAELNGLLLGVAKPKQSKERITP